MKFLEKHNVFDLLSLPPFFLDNPPCFAVRSQLFGFQKMGFSGGFGVRFLVKNVKFCQFIIKNEQTVNPVE